MPLEEEARNPSYCIDFSSFTYWQLCCFFLWQVDTEHSLINAGMQNWTVVRKQGQQETSLVMRWFGSWTSCEKSFSGILNWKKVWQIIVQIDLVWIVQNLCLSTVLSFFETLVSFPYFSMPNCCFQTFLQAKVFCCSSHDTLISEIKRHMFI